ncbi:dihydrofolate reductase [Tissierella praeacuta DSM 18095]|uniref:dihydrofolate reductase n=1 Tax=Tissierella praeacuta DSM 18095 TaxID=1123404 RepID=A0A1M4ZVS9_9FIRM|nr:dihydrofolate reductase [Tissierella praeacuta]TCU64359.1 dihydrofolate reductase [Tissierella praeacuta]SHF21927.1 dihydrofolate reductase [Tissierella praeacuta DSM 18095]SUP02459.1 Dihydrofolate reductase [Tissierella praeacuta]
MNLIAAVDECWAIGQNNELLYNIPLDKAFFKQKTIEKTVIMGKNTYLSLPNSKPLPNRKNIILSTTLQNVGCVCCKSMEETKSTVKNIDTDEIFIIGGEKVYNEFLPYCGFAYITKILKKTKLAKRL